MKFEQTAHVVAHMRPRLAAEIEIEPMLYNAGPELAASAAGPMASELLDMAFKLPGWEHAAWGPWSLDCRSHMLMRGWYPAIPGWHHDDVDRGSDGQPIYDREMPPDRKMLAVVIDAHDAPTVALTEWAGTNPYPTVDEAAVVDVSWPLPGDAPVYRYWDNEIRSMNLPTWRALSGRVIEFDPYDFHRARPAERTGWRWFARLTLNPGPRPDVAKVRAQTQVYLPVTNEGW